MLCFFLGGGGTKSLFVVFTSAELAQDTSNYKRRYFHSTPFRMFAQFFRDDVILS